MTTRCGKSFRASAAIVVAARGSERVHWSPAFATKLAFDPPLPRAKRDAIQMSDAVKICLAFGEGWPDVWNAVCCDALAGVLDVEYETEDDGGADDDVAGRAIVTFFACGETARAVARRQGRPGGGEAGVVHQAPRSWARCSAAKKLAAAREVAAPASRIRRAKRFRGPPWPPWGRVHAS